MVKWSIPDTLRMGVSQNGDTGSEKWRFQSGKLWSHEELMDLGLRDGYQTNSYNSG